MNAVWNSYGQLCGCPEIFKKSCKFFCRELDIRVTEIMTLEEELKIRWHYGYDEGKAAGLEKGAAQKQREIAKSMIKEGIAKEIIKKVTGLSAEEVEEL